MDKSKGSVFWFNSSGHLLYFDIVHHFHNTCSMFDFSTIFLSIYFIMASITLTFFSEFQDFQYLVTERRKRQEGEGGAEEGEREKKKHWKVQLAELINSLIQHTFIIEHLLSCARHILDQVLERQWSLLTLTSWLRRQILSN